MYIEIKIIIQLFNNSQGNSIIRLLIYTGIRSRYTDNIKCPTRLKYTRWYGTYTEKHLKIEFSVRSGNAAESVSMCKRNFAVLKKIESPLVQLDVSRNLFSLQDPCLSNRFATVLKLLSRCLIFVLKFVFQIKL